MKKVIVIFCNRFANKIQKPQLYYVCHFWPPVGKVKEHWDAYHSIVAKLSARVRNLAEEFDSIIVDFQMVFVEARKKAPDSYWIWDGIHPTVPGHELMAREKYVRQI